MTTRQDVIRKVIALRRLAADAGARGPEAETAARMADRLVAQNKITALELVPSHPMGSNVDEGDFSAMAVALRRAGIVPSGRQARGKL